MIALNYYSHITIIIHYSNNNIIFRLCQGYLFVFRIAFISKSCLCHPPCPALWTEVPHGQGQLSTATRHEMLSEDQLLTSARLSSISGRAMGVSSLKTFCLFQSPHYTVSAFPDLPGTERQHHWSSKHVPWSVMVSCHCLGLLFPLRVGTMFK